MAQPETNKEAPPLLMNGNVCPVVGNNSQFTPMWTSAWQVNQKPMPKASSLPKVPVASLAIFRAR